MSSNPNLQQRALEQFDRLLDLSADQIEAHLARLQTQDSELAGAVRKILRADAEQSGVLDRGVQRIAQSLLDTEHAATSPPTSTERKIGPFQLLRLLGEGGMGEVWLAERRDGAFVQQVALKLLKRGMDSEVINQRFLQERRILAELNHPHIAGFVDGGISDDGRLYLAMEYIAGLDVMTHCKSQQLDVPARVQLMIQVCEAVAHAQSHLVVHRDLKPSNVLIDTHGQPRVLDFGIAKLLLAERNGDATQQIADAMTATRGVILSPAYAAPEQILGERISTATDVYALGAILFELLTDQRPHARNAVSFKQLMSDAQSQITQTPSSVLKQNTQSRTWKQVNQDLDTIVVTALRREPERRYRSAQALADDLKRWQKAQPIAARPDTRSYRIKRFVARNRLAVGSASAVFLALLAGLSVALWQAGVAREQAKIALEQTRVAKLEFERAETARLDSDQMLDFFVDRLVAGNAGDNARGIDLTMREWLVQTSPLIGTSLKDTPRALTRISSVFGTLFQESADAESALKMFDQAVHSAHALKNSSAEKMAPATAAETLVQPYIARARLHSATGRYIEANNDLMHALALLDELPITPETANRLGKSKEAYAIGQRNLSDRIALLGADDPRLAVDHNNLGFSANKLGLYQDAQMHLSKARTLLTQNAAPNARVMQIDAGLALIALAEGERNAAQRMIHAAQKLAADLLSADHPDSILTGRSAAMIAMQNEQISEAEQYFHDNNEKVEALKPHWHSDYLLSYAQFLVIAGRYPEAEAACDRVLTMLTLDNLSPSKTLALVIRALAIVRSGRTDPLLAQVVTQVEALLQNENTSALLKGDASIYLAAIFKSVDRTSVADHWKAKALALYQQSMSERSARFRAKAWVPNA
jgi:eukaryotic-like serine/threonine-protein kinase